MYRTSADETIDWWRVVLAAALVLFGAYAAVAQAEIARFAGDYVGSAELVRADGSRSPRDLSVSIRAVEDGFAVQWTTVTRRANGTRKQSNYNIEFHPSDRPGVYAAGMRRNVFGHAVQLDPMKGEPYVWARIAGDTLSVYSLFVDAAGGYEMQQFDRTLAPGGLDLLFSRIRDGENQHSIRTFLRKRDAD